MEKTLTEPAAAYDPSLGITYDEWVQQVLAWGALMRATPHTFEICKQCATCKKCWHCSRPSYAPIHTSQMRVDNTAPPC